MEYLQMSSSRSRLSWKRPAVVALISLRDQLVSRAYPLSWVEKTHPQLQVYAMAGGWEQCWSKPTTLFTHEQSE